MYEDKRKSLSRDNLPSILEFVCKSFGLKPKHLALMLGVTPQSAYNWISGGPIAGKNYAPIMDLYAGAQRLQQAGVTLSHGQVDLKFDGVSIRDRVSQRQSVAPIIDQIISSFPTSAPTASAGPEYDVSCDACRFVYHSDGQLECHRYPPPWRNSMVEKDDWCGEFEARTKE